MQIGYGIRFNADFNPQFLNKLKKIGNNGTVENLELKFF
jgi:hypothetical protein